MNEVTENAVNEMASEGNFCIYFTGILSAWSDGFLCVTLLICLDMLGSLGRKLITLFIIYIIVCST